jgi:pimeloyl-ACP methyl ester carboxylesterase
LKRADEILGQTADGQYDALMAAAKEKRVAAVGLLGTPGLTGAETLLAQQQHLLDRMKIPPEERQAKIALQKKIQEAVITGKGWEQLPQELRKQVDNPEFQSILTSDPAKILPDVRQPILIVQGDLDTQVDPSNADGLEALAHKRKHEARVDKLKVPGVNHLLVPATTGEVDEYGSLKDKQVNPAVTDAIVTWLKRTL